MNQTTHKHPEFPCPSCDRVLAESTSADPTRGPAAGDLSVCWYCGALLVYQLGIPLTARLLRPDELRALPFWQQRELARLRRGVLERKASLN